MRHPLAKPLALPRDAEQRYPLPLDQPQPEHGAADDTGLFRHDGFDQAERFAHQPAMLLGADGIKFGSPHERLDLFRIALQHQEVAFADLPGLRKPGQPGTVARQPEDPHIILVGDRIEFTHRVADRFRATLDPRLGHIKPGVALQ